MILIIYKKIDNYISYIREYNTSSEIWEALNDILSEMKE
jgi:hypothetical protein